MFHTEQTDAISRARQTLLNESRRMQQEKGSIQLRPGEKSQVRTEEILREFLEQYESSLKEQARESRVNRWFSVASLVIAAISMFIAIVK